MIAENAQILVILSCLLVVIVLMIGLGGFAFGGDFNKKYANNNALENIATSYSNNDDYFFVYFSKGE